MKIEALSIRDPEVQDFLWRFVEPHDFRHDYTKLDAIKLIESQCYDQTCQLYGNMKEQFMFRCTVRNSKVIEPHIIGDGLKLRGAFDSGLPIAWALGFERAVIWTHHKRIARIAQRLGFTLNGVVPKVHEVDGELRDLYALSMEKQQCATSTQSVNQTTTNSHSDLTLLGA